MGKGKFGEKKAALESVHVLFSKAHDTKDVTVAKRYVAKARRLQMKFKLPLPAELKYRFCKECNAYWHPGKTVRIRTKNGMVIFACLQCKHMRKKRVR